ncbi:MAG: hypothetical protein ACHQX4_04150 [Gemmatimonadales bacterium]
MLVIALALAVVTQDTSRADSAAAGLVARARAARQRNERLVTSYTADVSQRIGVGIHALSRDRMLFHQELAAHIEWYRDRPSRIDVKGARQGIPIAVRGEQVPEDLVDQVRWLVIDPSEDYLRVIGAADSEGFVYPLVVGGESMYRFRAGDTTTITLPTGHTVQLLELVVTPRRSDFRLMSGSLWFDADSYALVRAVFRPARPFDLRRDADSSDRGDYPSWLPGVGVEVKYVTLEYGLYEFRWWMPRYIAVDAIATMGSLVGVPIRYERTYSDYHVEGGTPPVAGSTFRPAGSVRRGRGALARTRDSVRAREDSLRSSGVAAEVVAADTVLARLIADSTALRTRTDSIRQVRRECMRHERDSLRAAERRRDSRPGVQVQVRVGRSSCFPPDTALMVVVPQDSMALLTNADLGRPILDMGDVISEGELEQVGREIGALGQRPWEFHPELPRGVGDLLGHFRYNRIEALSLGLGAQVDFGRLKADGSARVGVADWEPDFELGLTRPTENERFRLGGYRRLAAANPDVAPLDLGNSLTALLIGRDDGEYFRTLGAEVTGAATSGWYRLRVFAERQRGASVGTEASLPHLFSPADTFRVNIAAQNADQAGAALTIRGSRTLSRALVVGAEASGEGATGTFRYAKGALTLRSTVLPPGPLVFGFEVAAGSSAGTVPVQSGYFLGGSPTLRGYDGGAFMGDAFWRGRFEVGTQLPAFRLAVFSDAGWAGARAAFQSGKAKWGGGVGASILDGLIRLDLARAFSAPRGWRFDIYLDGVL